MRSWGNEMNKQKCQQIKICLPLFLLANLMWLMLSCGDGSDQVSSSPTGLAGTVKNASGKALSGAKIYLVPVEQINTTPITAEELLDTDNRSAENRDEPLEDAVRLKGSEFITSETNASGEFQINQDIPEGSYYIYVDPQTKNALYLPGGDHSRIAMHTSAFEGTRIDIKLSATPSDQATYVGSSKCMTCHEDYAGIKYTAHKQGLSVPGVTGDLQNRSQFPYFEESTSFKVFKGVSAYTSGLKLTFGDYDSTQSFDKFKVVEDSSKITTALGNMYLWRDLSTDLYYITIVNTVNTSDPNSPLTLAVKLTYGGTLYKQRFLVQVPDDFATATGTTQRKGHYPLLQYQAYPGISTGSESNFDRTRLKWRDYHLDWWWSSGSDGAIGTSDDLLNAPLATKTFELNCATCHFTGYGNLSKNSTTGEWLADAVNDASGAYDIDSDGLKDEVNVGCESCHGPGSEHVADPDSPSIISLSYLTPSRENMVCGFCHDRSTGKGSSSASELQDGDMLFDENHELPLPGMSRAKVISEHMNKTGPALSKLHTDKVHSKSHHQQYSDFLKSKHYRNDRQLVVCSDCHDVHAKNALKGSTEYAHNLRGDPETPSSILCARCHNIDNSEHMEEKTAAQHAGNDTLCSDCHMPRTAKSGAGQAGLSYFGVTSSTRTSGNTYLMGDISSHLFDFIDKFNLGVAGSTPGDAMPSPYTNACGACHSVDELSSKIPRTKVNSKNTPVSGLNPSVIK